MSTKRSKSTSSPASFDFLNFQDSLQPYLDLLSVSCTALAYKANEHDDNGLNLIAHAIETQIEQIEELCNKYHALNSKITPNQEP